MQDGPDEKKMERKSRNQSDQNTKNQKTKIWDEQNIKNNILIFCLARLFDQDC